MSSGTGHGATAVFSNVTGQADFACRMRRVSTLQGIDREPVDFTDLETVNVMDIRPGDLVSPGTYELEFLADRTGSEPNRASAAQIAALVASTGDTLTITISNVLGGVMTAVGFVSSHDGPDLETNTPMEYRLTWQTRGISTWV